MSETSSIMTTIFGLTALAITPIAFKRCQTNQSYTLTPWLYPFGAFVWGDMTIFGPFWFLASATSLLLQDQTLFLLTYSLFWLIRSLGEVIYWFNQQFSPINRNPAHTLPFHRFYPQEDTIWYIYQIFWQCLAVITTLSSLFLANKWLS